MELNYSPAADGIIFRGEIESMSACDEKASQATCMHTHIEVSFSFAFTSAPCWRPHLPSLQKPKHTDKVTKATSDERDTCKYTGRSAVCQSLAMKTRFSSP